MIDVNDDAGKVLALYVRNKLSKGDLNDLVPTMEQHITKTEDPHLIMILDDFKGWRDTAAFWKEIRLDAEYLGYFNRIAVVGDKKWQQWGTQLLNPITKEELRFFQRKDVDQAWKWLDSTSHRLNSN